MTETEFITEKVYFSSNFYQMTGLSPDTDFDEEESVFALIHPADRERFVEAAKEAFGLGSDFNITARMRAREGYTWIHVSSSLTIDKEGKGQWFGLCMDATESQRLLEALFRFERVVETTSQALFVVEPHAAHFYHNSAATKLFGGKLNSYEELKSLLSDQSRNTVELEIEPTLAETKHWVGELDLRNRNGTEIPVRVRVTAQQESITNTFLVFGSIVDNTEEVEHSRELRAATRYAKDINRTKTWLLNELNHDLNEPLNTAALLVDTLVGDLPDQKHRHLMDMVGSSLLSLKEILATLMAYSRFDSADDFPISNTEFSVRSLLKDVFNSFESRMKMHGFEFRLVATDCVVRTDYDLLRKSIVNLLRDALRNVTSVKILMGCRIVKSAPCIDILFWVDAAGLARYEAIAQDCLSLEDDPDCSHGIDIDVALTIPKLIGAYFIPTISPTNPRTQLGCVRWRLVFDQNQTTVDYIATASDSRARSNG